MTATNHSNSSRYGKQSGAQRVEVVGPDFSRVTGGSYSLALCSGLLTVVAAQTATAGHVAAFRNSSTTNQVVINRILAKWWTTTGFTSAQVVGLNLVTARGYTTSHSGGTAATITTSNGKKNVDHATISGIDFRIGTTAELTPGVHTLDAQAFANEGTQELAASATVPLKKFTLDYTPVAGRPLVLHQDEGFIVGNRVLGGTAGVWNVAVEVDFDLVTDGTFLL